MTIVALYLSDDPQSIACAPKASTKSAYSHIQSCLELVGAMEASPHDNILTRTPWEDQARPYTSAARPNTRGSRSSADPALATLPFSKPASEKQAEGMKDISTAFGADVSSWLRFLFLMSIVYNVCIYMSRYHLYAITQKLQVFILFFSLVPTGGALSLRERMGNTNPSHRTCHRAHVATASRHRGGLDRRKIPHLLGRDVDGVQGDG